MSKYWETEELVVVEIEKNIFKLCRAAWKLQVSAPPWREPGTVTVDLDALRDAQEAVELLRQAIGL